MSVFFGHFFFLKKIKNGEEHLQVELVRSIPGYCPHRYEKVELRPLPVKWYGKGGHLIASTTSWHAYACVHSWIRNMNICMLCILCIHTHIYIYIHTYTHRTRCLHA